MTVKPLLILTAIFTLSACAAPYRIARDAPSAELTFVAEGGGADAFICDLERHEFRKLGTSARSTSAGGNFLSGLTWGLSDMNKPIIPVVQQIEAGRRVRIFGSSGAIGAGNTMDICSIAIDLIPEVGGRYKVNYRYDLTANQCSIELQKYDLAQQDWKPHPALPDSPECKKKS